MSFTKILDDELAESNVDALLQTLNIDHSHIDGEFGKEAIDKRHGR